MEDRKTIEKLFQRYLNNECNREEIKKLLQYFGEEKNETLLRSLISRQLEENEDAPVISLNSLLEATFNNIKKAMVADNKTGQKAAVPLYARTWFRVCAAAVFIFFLSTAVFFLFHNKGEAIVAHKENKIQPAIDIAPGKNNAILTLDDGTSIVLDSAANGALAQQGNIKVLKLNGQIAYNKTSNRNLGLKPVYNTITTANGNQYQLILADGSKVWLNAASSIRFPASFAGNERKVEITGEAYFEVTKDAKKPFKVGFNDQAGGSGEIEVLGTHFNVNVYPDEPDSKTTLLEGSVKIKRANEVQILSPGQQADLSSKGIVLKKDVDVQQAVAWKYGFFLFNNTDIYTLMRQVERWYDVKVNFEGNISEDGYSGKISRDVPLSKLLKVLELNDIHVKTSGRRITVTQ